MGNNNRNCRRNARRRRRLGASPGGGGGGGPKRQRCSSKRRRRQVSQCRGCRRSRSCDRDDRDRDRPSRRRSRSRGSRSVETLRRRREMSRERERFGDLHGQGQGQGQDKQDIQLNSQRGRNVYRGVGGCRGGNGNRNNGGNKQGQGQPGPANTNGNAVNVIPQQPRMCYVNADFLQGHGHGHQQTPAAEFMALSGGMGMGNMGMQMQQMGSTWMGTMGNEIPVIVGLGGGNNNTAPSPSPGDGALTRSCVMEDVDVLNTTRNITVTVNQDSAGGRTSREREAVLVRSTENSNNKTVEKKRHGQGHHHGHSHRRGHSNGNGHGRRNKKRRSEEEITGRDRTSSLSLEEDLRHTIMKKLRVRGHGQDHSKAAANAEPGEILDSTEEEDEIEFLENESKKEEKRKCDDDSLQKKKIKKEKLSCADVENEVMCPSPDASEKVSDSRKASEEPCDDGEVFAEINEDPHPVHLLEDEEEDEHQQQLALALLPLPRPYSAISSASSKSSKRLVIVEENDNNENVIEPQHVIKDKPRPSSTSMLEEKKQKHNNDDKPVTIELDAYWKSQVQQLRAENALLKEKVTQKENTISLLKKQLKIADEKEIKIRILRGRKTAMENELEGIKKNLNKSEKHLRDVENRLKKAEEEVKVKEDELANLKKSVGKSSSASPIANYPLISNGDPNKVDLPAHLALAFAYQDRLYTEVEKVKASFEIEVIKLQEYYESRLASQRFQQQLHQPQPFGHGHGHGHGGHFLQGLPAGAFPKGCVVTPLGNMNMNMVPQSQPQALPMPNGMSGGQGQGQVPPTPVETQRNDARSNSGAPPPPQLSAMFAHLGGGNNTSGVDTLPSQGILNMNLPGIQGTLPRGSGTRIPHLYLQQQQAQGRLLQQQQQQTFQNVPSTSANSSTNNQPNANNPLPNLQQEANLNLNLTSRRY